MGQWTAHYWIGHREDGRVAVADTVDAQRPPDWLGSPREITREEWLEAKAMIEEAAIRLIKKEAAKREARRRSPDDPYTGIGLYQTKTKGPHDSRILPVGETAEGWRTHEVEFTLDNGRTIRVSNEGDRLHISTTHGTLLTIATGGNNTLEIVNMLRPERLLEYLAEGRI